MILLLDTHLVLWAAYEPERLSESVRASIAEAQNTVLFSAASIWEVAIKAGLGREGFEVDPRVLRRGLLENGWLELAVTAEHAAHVIDLPLLHRDPFDRMLVAQCRAEGVALLTVDSAVAAYGPPVRLV